MNRQTRNHYFHELIKHENKMIRIRNQLDDLYDIPWDVSLSINILIDEEKEISNKIRELRDILGMI